MSVLFSSGKKRRLSLDWARDPELVERARQTPYESRLCERSHNSRTADGLAGGAGLDLPELLQRVAGGGKIRGGF
jgi:hypothetical protein